MRFLTATAGSVRKLCRTLISIPASFTLSSRSSRVCQMERERELHNVEDAEDRDSNKHVGVVSQLRTDGSTSNKSRVVRRKMSWWSRRMMACAWVMMPTYRRRSR